MEGIECCQLDRNAGKVEEMKDDDGRKWSKGEKMGSLRPPGWFWEGIVCAVLNGRAPARCRGSRVDREPILVVVEKPWSEEAREEKLGDRKEA